MGKVRSKEVPLPNLAVPSFEFLQARIKALYPTFPSTGIVAKHTEHTFTPKELKIWEAVVGSARATNVPSEDARGHLPVERKN